MVMMVVVVVSPVVAMETGMVLVIKSSLIIIIKSLFHHKIKPHILCYNELKKPQKSTYTL